MTSKIKVDNINKVSDDSNIIKKCGTTTTIGSGASNPIVVDGSAITLGRCGGTVALASGATQSGFGRTGTVNWDTTKITADPSTAATGVGYFTDTSGSAFNVTLPASPSAGDIVAVADYANNWATNAVTILRNGSNIEGSAADFKCNITGSAITFVFVDATKGWITTNTGNSTQANGSKFVAATGGTETTSGNFKIHTFTGPGSFDITCAGNSCGSSKISYMVVAAGAGGGADNGGGGGAGGFRESKSSEDTYTASPLNATSGPTYNLGVVTGASYPVTVGAGGTPGTFPPAAQGGTGNNSVFAGTVTITSSGGGGGGKVSTNGTSGGSGGGGGACSSTSRAAGNTPPVSPAQGTQGGYGDGPGAGPLALGGGGGGATQEGFNADRNAPFPATNADGGAGATTGINGSNTTFSGGGGGGTQNSAPAVAGSGGAGGGGDGSSSAGTPNNNVPAPSGTANTGGGGGGAKNNAGGGGGSGIVIIRYKFQ